MKFVAEGVCFLLILSIASLGAFQIYAFLSPPPARSERGGEIQGQKPRFVAPRTSILKSGVFVFLKKCEEPKYLQKLAPK
jgi:hypothetical protein